MPGTADEHVLPPKSVMVEVPSALLTGVCGASITGLVLLEVKTCSAPLFAPYSVSVTFGVFLFSKIVKALGDNCRADVPALIVTLKLTV